MPPSPMLASDYLPQVLAGAPASPGLGYFYQSQIDAPAGDLGRRRRGLEAEGYAPCALVAGA